MSNIQAIEAIVARVPLEQPTHISTRVLGHRDYLLVRITDAAGNTGWGYTYAGTNGGTVLREIVDAVFTPLLLGRDSEGIADLWAEMYQEALLIGRRGAVIRALSAVDIGLWDLKAWRYKAPLATLLGGTLEPVVAYASGGYYKPNEGVWADAVGREIELNISKGFTDHKIKVGGLPIQEDALRVAAAVKTMDGHGRLALDANNAYRNSIEALEALRAFEAATDGYGLWWFEEPLSPEDVAGHADLRRRADTAIATGEIHQTRWDFTSMYQSQAADYIQADVGVLGGITEWIRVAHTAESFNVGIAPHWHANLHAVLSAATPGCFTVEHFLLEKDIYNFERLVTVETRQAYEDGKLLFLNQPGMGFDFDLDAIERFRV